MSVSLLVTAGAGGDLAYLTRLYTLLKALKRGLPAPVYLLDVGGAWSAENWLCQATENRAPYIMLDAMGYTLAFADGLNAENAFRLAPHMALALVHPDYTGDLYPPEGHLEVAQGRGWSQPHVAGGVLRLPHPPKGEVWYIGVEKGEAGWHISATNRHLLPPETLPDSTMVGTSEFILSEARYYHKKKGAKP
jgi:hypothetical protein